MKTQNTFSVVIIVGLVALAGFGVWKLYQSGKLSRIYGRLEDAKTAVVKKIEEKKSQGSLIVVNVLDKKMYDDAHIKGSIHVDYSDLTKEAQKWDKNATVVIYCADYLCGASYSGAQQLAALGFKDVRAYEGGMAEWYQLHQKDSAYELEGPAQLGYLAVASKKPNVHHEGTQVKEISAQELRDLLKAS